MGFDQLGKVVTFYVFMIVVIAVGAGWLLRGCA